MQMRYLLSYRHNGHGEGPGWRYGCEYSQQRFSSPEAVTLWIKAHPQYTPCKLGKWDDRAQCFVTIVDYTK